MQDYASSAGIEVFSPVSHTLFNPADIIEKVGEEFVFLTDELRVVLAPFHVLFSMLIHGYFVPMQKNGGSPPLSYQSFLKLAGEPSWASSPLSIRVSSLPPVGDVGSCEVSQVPTMEELGYVDNDQVWDLF